MTVCSEMLCNTVSEHMSPLGFKFEWFKAEIQDILSILNQLAEIVGQDTKTGTFQQDQDVWST
jgi:hypothetical protein